MAQVSSLKRRLPAPMPDAAASLQPSAAAPELPEIFKAHYASVWRLLRRLGVQHAHLDDCAQEVFWVAARRLHDIQPGRQQAFLYGVAMRVASQQVQKQRAHLPHVELDAALPLVDLAPTPEEQLVQGEARALLDAVLDGMRQELREVFVLFELEGLALQEIAALFELPIGTASSRLRRAREEFSAIAKRARASLAARERSRP